MNNLRQHFTHIKRNILMAGFLTMAMFVALRNIFHFPLTDITPTRKVLLDQGSDGIKVFYNVYANNGANDAMQRAKEYVKEQMAMLLPEHEVMVRNIGAKIEVENATTIQHDFEGSEIGTLKLLWDYCHETSDPSKKIVYIHNKGSFHPSRGNDLLRKWLTRAALSKECSNMPFSCDVCSYRMSPLPHPHTPGNMWLARCNYISKLIDPSIFQLEMAKLYYNGDLSQDDHQLGTGRFASEHWVHSHPSIRACDLSTSYFLWGYAGIPEVYDGFKLEASPRYDWNNFAQNAGHVPEKWKRDHRQAEYEFLYKQTPPAAWFGWNFYSDNIPKSVPAKKKYVNRQETPS